MIADKETSEAERAKAIYEKEALEAEEAKRDHSRELREAIEAEAVSADVRAPAQLTRAPPAQLTRAPRRPGNGRFLTAAAPTAVLVLGR